MKIFYSIKGLLTLNLKRQGNKRSLTAKEPFSVAVLHRNCCAVHCFIQPWDLNEFSPICLREWVSSGVIVENTRSFSLDLFHGCLLVLRPVIWTLNGK